jgi:hypothetical protein
MSARTRRHNNGIALAVVLVIVFVAALGAAAFLGVTGSDLHLTHREVELTRAFYVAQAGIEKAVAELKVLYSKGRGHTAAELAAISPPDYDGFTFDEFSVVIEGVPEDKTLEHGTYKGLRGRVQTIKITARVSSEHSGEVAQLSELVEAQFIPIFQFAIFYYADDLEILPGPAMTVNGPVHCNSDVYMGTNTSLTFESMLTCAGSIYHRRKDGSAVSPGPVEVKDGDGVYRDMRNLDGSWLDCDHPNWYEGSQERWDGNVKSAVHHVSPLRMPLSTSEHPRELIERGDALDTPEAKELKYYYKADVRIIDGKAYDSSGWEVDLTYPDPADPTKRIDPISTKTFYNYREGQTVSVTEVDVEKLRAGGKAPSNGILYVSDSRAGLGEQDAVRLVNGDELPAQGLTVVTDNPLYIQGDYNTVRKKPASVMCDAINILSNNWNDANSEKSLWERRASDTTMNVAVIAGNTVTTEGQYNGGVENMPRFLETWSGKTLTYRGSLVAMWVSEVATGDWIYGAPYYEAPNRNWGYDVDLNDPANAPPGMPSVYAVEVARWQYSD